MVKHFSHLSFYLYLYLFLSRLSLSLNLLSFFYLNSTSVSEVEEDKIDLRLRGCSCGGGGGGGGCVLDLLVVVCGFVVAVDFADFAEFADVVVCCFPLVTLVEATTTGCFDLALLTTCAAFVVVVVGFVLVGVATL